MKLKRAIISIQSLSTSFEEALGAFTNDATQEKKEFDKRVRIVFDIFSIRFGEQGGEGGLKFVIFERAQLVNGS